MEDSAATRRKRPRKDQDQRKERERKGPLCSFCLQTPAAVTVKPPALSSAGKSNLKAPPAEAYCVLHYYTTSAVRANPAGVSILNQLELDAQLIPMQELFAEAFVQLQQELSEQSARAFAAHSNDPLAILHDLNKKRRKRASPAVASKKGITDKNEGGFMRDIPLPERLLRTQHQQAQLQASLTQRMNRAAQQQQPSIDSRDRSKDISKRRKGSRKSIWNVIIDQDEKRAQGKSEESPQDISSLAQDPSPYSHGVHCSCGSHKVEVVGSSANRSGDMRKGETWGSKDRADEVVTRYRCNGCGKTFNEEE